MVRRGSGGRKRRDRGGGWRAAKADVLARAAKLHDPLTCEICARFREAVAAGEITSNLEDE